MKNTAGIRDGSYKWTHVPYWLSITRLTGAILSAGDQKLAIRCRFFLMADAAHQPGPAVVHLLERELDAMQCIEAIRLYTSAMRQAAPKPGVDHRGPGPLDPATGKPFLYQCERGFGDPCRPGPSGLQDPTAWRRAVLRGELR